MESRHGSSSRLITRSHVDGTFTGKSGSKTMVCRAMISSNASSKPVSKYTEQEKVTDITSAAPAKHQNAVERRLRAILGSNSVKYLIAGAVAGMVSRTVVSPLEVLSTIAMVSSSTHVGLRESIQTIFREQGIKGFFRGNLANCLKVAPTKGIQFVAFEGFKKLMYQLREVRSAKRSLILGQVDSETSSSTSSLEQSRSAKSSKLATVSSSKVSLKQPANNQKQRSNELSAWERLTAGGFAGMIAAAICYPLEVAKTLLTALPDQYHGILGSMRKIVSEKGPSALYRGLNPTLVAMFPYVGLEFMIYEHLKLAYARRKNEEPPMVVLLLVGAFAGALAQTACHPLDVVRKRLQLQGIGGRPVLYKNTIHTAMRMVREEGFGSLYRGLKPAYLSVLPSAGVSYVVYEQMKHLLHVESLK